MNNLTIAEKYFIEEFNENFYHLRETPVVLYGVGEYTKLILNEVKDLNFVGLMDQKVTGEIIYGLKVLDFNEVKVKARAIIIVANLSVSEIIYRRIEKLNQVFNIDIYYLNGLKTKKNNMEMHKNGYCVNIVEELKNQISKNDVISFDIFDTLVMRKCLKPTIIFEILERYLLLDKNINCDFKKKRVEAEKICYRRITKYFDLNLIYEQLESMLNFSKELINEIKKKELYLEYNYIIPKVDMIEIMNYAKRNKKIVILTSDMYLDKSILLPILKKCNIYGFDNALISCNVKKSKYSGDIWNYIKEIYPNKKILHIGDNVHSDVELPKKFGISTFHIKNSIEIINMLEANKFITKPNSIEDYIALGLFSSLTCNNTLNLCKNNGKINVKSMFDIGYLFFGPIVLKYILWLVEKINEEKIDVILFPARDGYILEKIYNNILVKSGLKMPKAIYFLASRRASSVASIRSDKDIIFIVENMCNISSIKVKDVLYNAFGIKEKELNDFMEKSVYEIGKNKLTNYIIQNYKYKILKNAKEERNGYLKYINNLELVKYKNIGFVNFVGKGITQKFITSLVGKELTGLYFATEVDILKYYKSIDNIFTCYGSCLSTHTSKINIVSKYLFGEVIFSAPQEQLLKFNDLGEPIYLEKSDRDFSGIEDCHKGIIKYIDDIFNLIFDNNIQLHKILKFEKELNATLVDDIFGILFSNYCNKSNEVRQSLKFYDSYKSENGLVLFD